MGLLCIAASHRQWGAPRALLVSNWSIASDAATRLTVATFDLLKASGEAGAARKIELNRHSYRLILH